MSGNRRNNTAFGENAPGKDKGWRVLLTACVCLLLTGLLTGCLALSMLEYSAETPETAAPAQSIQYVQSTEEEQTPSIRYTPAPQLPDGEYEAFFAKHEAMADRESLDWRSIYADYGLERLLGEQYMRYLGKPNPASFSPDWYEDEYATAWYDFVDLNFDDIPELVASVGGGMSHHSAMTSVYVIRDQTVELLWDSPLSVGSADDCCGMDVVLVEDTGNGELAWMLQYESYASVGHYLGTGDDCRPDRSGDSYDVEIERIAIIKTNDRNELHVDKTYDNYVFRSWEAWDDESLAERKCRINWAFVEPAEYDAQYAADAGRYRKTDYVIRPEYMEARALIPYYASGDPFYCEERTASAKNWIRARDMFPAEGAQLFDIPHHRDKEYPDWYEKYDAYVREKF